MTAINNFLATQISHFWQGKQTNKQINKQFGYRWESMTFVGRIICFSHITHARCNQFRLPTGASLSLSLLLLLLLMRPFYLFNWNDSRPIDKYTLSIESVEFLFYEFLMKSTTRKVGRNSARRFLNRMKCSKKHKTVSYIHLHLSAVI